VDSSGKSNLLVLEERVIRNLLFLVVFSELRDGQVSIELVWIWVLSLISQILQELSSNFSVFRWVKFIVVCSLFLLILWLSCFLGSLLRGVLSLFPLGLSLLEFIFGNPLFSLLIEELLFTIDFSLLNLRFLGILCLELCSFIGHI
jgi:hypothetical protein